MAKDSVPRPTDAELAILRVLWERGPSTVRHVHDVLSADRALAYTTTLKLLQIMTEKGLVAREEDSRSHVYTARQGEDETQRRLVGDLLERAFGGSATKLVMQALAGRTTSAEDRAEIRRLLGAFDPSDGSGSPRAESRGDENSAHPGHSRGTEKEHDRD